jgi:hypothetical protein
MDHSWRKFHFSIVLIPAVSLGLGFFLSAWFLGPYIGFLSLLPVIIAAPFLLALMFDLTPREAALAAGALTIYKMLLSTAFVFIFGAGR